MTFFSGLITDLREAKAAAESHNVSNYEPSPTGSLAMAKPDGDPEVASTSHKPPVTSTTAAQPPSGPAGTQQTYIPPPPPPKNLPHGWTARYDAKEGKFFYSHGVGSKSEQWDFPTETEKTT